MQRLGWVSGPRDPGNGASFHGVTNSTPRNNKVYRQNTPIRRILIEGYDRI